ncbi:MAG: hypothetical protein EP298_01690 [Gammaproteobacteria bacterium]|nr:MAG: hypothetical protein EP298_01690 [Gammaproteobacteria bacterium]UTW43917.1 hypothetical protein KFE69_07460 [bacterium SCSIO 12844]
MILNKFAAKSIILAMTSAIATTAFAVSDSIEVTFKNDSGKTLYADIVNETAPFKVYNFTKGGLDTNFNVQQNVLEIKPGSHTVDIPAYAFSGAANARIYISTDRFSSDLSNVPGTPNLATYPYVYDKIEASADGIWDTTSVDFFGMPMQVSYTKNYDKTVGFCTRVYLNKDGIVTKCAEGMQGSLVTRQLVIENLEKNLKQQSLLYGSRFFYGQDENGDPVRIFSPLHFYASSFNSSVWSSYINESLKKLGQLGQKFNFNYGGYKFHDISYSPSDNNSLTVYSDSDNKYITISNITLGNAVGGTITNDGSAAEKKFAGMIATAINRGVLDNPAHWGESGGNNVGYPQYYYPNYPNKIAHNPTYNLYAATLIPYGVDGKLYANSYDDFWHMDSSLQVDPSNYQNGVTITILPFTSDTPSKPTISWPSANAPTAEVPYGNKAVNVTMRSASINNTDTLKYTCSVSGEANKCKVDSIDQDHLSVKLSNLDQALDTQYQVTATDVNQPTVSASITGQIKWDQAPSTIDWDKKITVSKVTQTSAQITWDKAVKPIDGVNYTYDITGPSLNDHQGPFSSPQMINQENLQAGATYNVQVTASSSTDSETASKSFSTQSDSQSVTYYGETGTAPATIQDEDGNVLIKFSSTESKQFTLPKGKPVIAVYQGGKCQITAHTSTDAESLLINNGVPVHFPPCPINFNTTAHASFITMQFPS